ncbi:FAD-binding oxidoreductase [[Eubacterium] cellulosolvens]
MALEKTVTDLLGSDRVSTSYLERVAYSHDLAPLPRNITRLFNSLPDIIVKPQSLDEVASIIKLANRLKVPLTPRGSATWGYGGAVPTMGGILLDLRGLNKILSFDEAGGLLTVQCGAVWNDILDFLEKTNWELPVYPSSAPSSTVGGFAATGGLGYGSLEHGSLVENVASVTIILPTGEKTVVHPNSDWVKLGQLFGSEGTLCVFGELTLRLVPRRPSATPFLAYFHQLSNAVAVANDLVRRTKPFSLILRAFGFVRAREGALLSPEDAESGAIIFGYYAGMPDRVEESLSSFARMVADRGGILRPREEAEFEWSERFYPLRIKKLGPTVLTSDVLVPSNRLIEMVQYAWQLGSDASMDVEIENIWISPDQVLFFPLFLSDERRTFRYLSNSAITKKLIDRAIAMGGRSYGYGVWNSFHFAASEPTRRREFAKLKTMLDPNGVLNPGKTLTAKTRIGLSLPKVLYAGFLETLWRLGAWF